MAIHQRFSKRVSKRFVIHVVIIVAVVFFSSLWLSRRSSPKLVPCVFRVEGSCVVLERVESTTDLQLGLSNRDRLAPRRGMLFDFPENAQQCMWMKAMRFNLDMIWLDDNGTVTKIIENVSPDTFPQAFCGSGKYVIEVNSGIIHQAGIQTGDRLKL